MRFISPTFFATFFNTLRLYERFYDFTFKMLYTAVLAFALMSSVHGHFFMNSPKPIPSTAPKDPLVPSGADFPCHGVPLSGLTGQQAMSAGSSQILTFDAGLQGENTAVHGGGSCQLSVTYETDPAKVKDPKNWKVIHSIVGGCPSSTYANLDGQYTGPSGSYSGAQQCSDPKTNGVDCVNAFNYTIPQDIKNGNAVLAWTWFNTIGNREMYMNCAAVDFSGGKDDDSGMSAKPDMFVANLADVGSCPTTQSANLVFPNPGTSVETKTPEGPAATAKQFPFQTPAGSGCGEAAAAPTGGAAPVSSAAPAPTTAAASSPAPAVSSAAPVPAAPAPAQGVLGKVPCSGDGSLVCISATQFGICDHGAAIPQPVAAGTTCQNGAIVKRFVVPPHVRGL